MWLLYRLVDKIRDLAGFPRHAYQRVTRGYSDRDIWNFDRFLVDIIPPAIRDLKHADPGHPIDLDVRQWNDILDQIASGFEDAKRLMNDYDIAAEDRDEMFSNWKRAWSLMGDRFFDLWW